MRFPCIISRTYSLKEGYKTKNIMILKLLETIENLCRSKNYNSCNTNTANKNSNNDSEIPNLNNTPLAPPQWDISSTT